MQEPKTVIHVGGLPAGIEEGTIYAAFVPFGEIKSVDLPQDQLTSIPMLAQP